jgi:hypothetical protein
MAVRSLGGTNSQWRRYLDHHHALVMNNGIRNGEERFSEPQGNVGKVQLLMRELRR